MPSGCVRGAAGGSGGGGGGGGGRIGRFRAKTLAPAKHDATVGADLDEAFDAEWQG